MRITVTMDLEEGACEAGVEVRDGDGVIVAHLRFEAQTLHGLMHKLERYVDGRLLAAGINANP